MTNKDRNCNVRFADLLRMSFESINYCASIMTALTLLNYTTIDESEELFVRVAYRNR